MRNAQLPDPPNQQPYVLTRLAASAGKHMKRLRRNWSLTKSDITKSLSRMTKKKSRTDLTTNDEVPPPLPLKQNSRPSITITDTTNDTSVLNTKLHDGSAEVETLNERNNKSLPRKSILSKFKRSMSITNENGGDVTKSTFYVTDAIDVDGYESLDKKKEKTSPVAYKVPVRPNSPPPPAPIKLEVKVDNNQKNTKRSTSWYAECGLFKTTENHVSNSQRRPSSFWYAEVGLYRSNESTPSTSSTENSGNNSNGNFNLSDTINQDNREEYFNKKNKNGFSNNDIDSFNSVDTKTDKSMGNLSNDMHLKLQDEPLYQFYDAAVLEVRTGLKRLLNFFLFLFFTFQTVCKDGTFDFDSDGYEEVGEERNSMTMRNRPSAMELVAPNKEITHARTLWCEIPEVIQSGILGE